ncbi:PqiC family protein [Vibrio marisflavi]|uniref:Type IV secretion system putative lipoprotein virB7 n=1 Tax=Vibrio marisflavi CECT 7928 TaxID=634439 RepID=A0ABM9A094_9VIBR|nr:ABC-type transport auxiliary lipoprotein family protein [Vibrio marisflavi]CAH0536795.1 Intermembrane transport lipoprotein PqiC [Vibrio marisflavi CECT 7928]
MMKKYILIALSVITLTACSSTNEPVSQEYLLPNNSAVAAYKTGMGNERLTIQLRPINVADYLKRLNIVMVNSDGKVYQAANHLWAEPLASQLEGLSLNRLSQRLPNTNWLPSSQIISNALTLQIDVANFYANFEGEIVISGRWYLTSDTNKLVDSGVFSKTTKLTKDGYTSMTAQLAKTWLTDVVDPIAIGISNLKLN